MFMTIRMDGNRSHFVAGLVSRVFIALLSKLKIYPVTWAVNVNLALFVGKTGERRDFSSFLLLRIFQVFP
jgi:hypothetical protein